MKYVITLRGEVWIRFYNKSTFNTLKQAQEYVKGMKNGKYSFMPHARFHIHKLVEVK